MGTETAITPEQQLLYSAQRLKSHPVPYCIPMTDGPDNGGGFVTSTGDIARVAEFVVQKIGYGC